MSRRNFLVGTTVAALSVSAGAYPRNLFKTKRMGIASPSYAIRLYQKPASNKFPAFQNSVDLIQHCHEIGAGGVQTGVGDWTGEWLGKIRDRREKLDLFLEGQISLPKDKSDVDRFTKEVQQAREAGATILRTVCLSGRRYETFKTLEEFKTFKKNSIASLELAEPIVRKAKLKLAVENHKDWRIAEFLELLQRFDSEWIGVTLDTGNNLSLLEDPMTVVEALAPYTLTVHFKDMAFEPYEDGFLLSEVPLGQGVLDLKQMIAVCEKHNPQVNFNLEMITRDPLEVPCLTDTYWATFENLSGLELARTLKRVQQEQWHKPLPRISNQSTDKQLELEEENIRLSFDYAKKELGFS